MSKTADTSVFSTLARVSLMHMGPPPLDQPVVFGYDEQVDGGPGRIETRRVWSTEALEGLISGERGRG